MEITWHPPKRESNIVKHKLDFAEIGEEYFDAAIFQPAREGRWKAIGWLGPIVVAVIFQPRGDAALTIISARRASRKERKFFNG